MKQKHIIKAIVALLLTLSFQACRDDFDISQISEPRKLSVNCYPSTADTTWIWVSRTIPVDKQSTVHQDFSIGNASIIYQVNGQPREVCEKEPGLYYTCSPQKVGDKVTIEVSANGFERVTSEATVPNAIPIRLEGLKKITTYNHDIDRFATYDQLTATFSDPEATTDFYAVRVRAINYKGLVYGVADPVYDENGHIDHYQTQWSLGDSRGTYANYLRYKEMYPNAEWHVELQDSVYSYPTISVDDEPLLNPLSEFEENFGFNNRFFRQFYIFSDATINGQTYTLHLNIPKNYWLEKYQFMTRLQVQLYHISPELYRYAKALNDAENNEWAQGGFSILSPTPSNIVNGVGIMGGYHTTETTWITKTYE